ncbi:unnamed protein product, partial [Mesorhabditis spiculigera]
MEAMEVVETNASEVVDEPFEFLRLPLIPQEEILANCGLLERARLRQVCKDLKNFVELHGPLPEKMLRVHIDGQPGKLRVVLCDEYHEHYTVTVDENGLGFKFGRENPKEWTTLPSDETVNNLLKHVRPRFVYYTRYVDDMSPESLDGLDIARQSICVSLRFICMARLLERMRRRGFENKEILNFVWIRDNRSCFYLHPCQACANGYEALLEFLPKCRKIYLRSRVELFDAPPVDDPPQHALPLWKPTEDSIRQMILDRAAPEHLNVLEPRMVAIDLEDCNIEGQFKIISQLDIADGPIYLQDEKLYIYILSRSTYGYKAFLMIQNFEMCYLGQHYEKYEDMLRDLRDTNHRYPVVCRPK